MPQAVICILLHFWSTFRFESKGAFSRLTVLVDLRSLRPTSPCCGRTARAVVARG